MEEIFKDIPGYVGKYQVSNLGRVKSLKRNKETILTPGISTQGYYIVSLYVNKTKKTRSIHQLVAETFLNHKPCGMELVVNHIDFNRQNNSIENIEILTARQNVNQKHIKSTSIYTGVSLNKQTQRWMSNIHVNGKQKYLGLFNCETKAHLVYQKALKELC